MKRKYGYRRVLAVILALILLLTGTVYAAAEPMPKLQVGVDNASPKTNGGVMESPLKYSAEGAKIQNHQSGLLGAVTLPSSYSSKNYGYVPTPLDQGDHGLCWAFTQSALASINVKKDEGKSVTYSKTHMSYSLSDDFGNTKGFWRNVGGDGAGGNRDMSVAYLSRGSGFVFDAEDPYVTGNMTYRDPSAVDGKFSTGYLESAPMLDNASVQQIKELIYEYGAAGCSIYYDDYYYNNSTDVYRYSGNNSTNHAITLIGWDDSRSAFLAMNSWGTNWGNDGFFYVSYYDSKVKECVFATDYESDELPYDGIRSYNDFGSNSYIYYDSAISYGTTYNTGDALTLEGVGTYVLSPNTKVEIYLNPYNGNGMDSSKFKLVHTEIFATPGYYHISFANQPYLYGSQFNVRIKVSKTDGTQVRAPFQRNLGYYLYNSRFHANTSYIGYGNYPSMELLEDCYGSTPQSEGWVWSMHAFTNSDLALSAKNAKVVPQGEEYKVTLVNTLNNSVLNITRNGAKLPIYSNSTCQSPVSNNQIISGNTYYMKLGNGTHIRRKITVGKSGSAPFSSVYTVNGVFPDLNNSFTFNIGGNTFNPTVSTYYGEDWALYALPNGVGRIGTSFKPTLYRTVIYLRIFGMDGISATDYPITLFANQASTNGIKDWSKVSNWAKEDVKTAVQYSLLSGDSSGNLNPKGNLTRAQAASMLVRFAGMEASKTSKEYAAVYSDVALNKWYAPAISTSSYIGMISGHSNPGYRCFSPENSVTREQYASMMIRLLAYVEGTDVNTYISRYRSAANNFVQMQNYADISNVSSWAKDSMNVALYLGIFNGATKQGRLYINPKSNITKEQTAVTIVNSLDLLQN